MAEPVGITGTALAVATLLYSTCKTISDIISSYKEAPKEYRDLARELSTLQGILNSLQSSLRGTNDSSLSVEQRDSLEELERPLSNCTKVCEGFKAKLSNMTSHSNEDHTAVWDRLRLHFNKSDVKFLREKLHTAQGTIQVALGVSTLKKVAQSQTTLDVFQESTATTMSELSGKVEGIALSIDALSISGVSLTQRDVEIVKRKLDDHRLLLRQCLSFCMSALSAAHASSPGTQVKHAKAIDHARQIIGNFGPIKSDAPAVSVETAEASGLGTFQAIGNTDLTGLNKDALDFLAGK